MGRFQIRQGELDPDTDGYWFRGTGREYLHRLYRIEGDSSRKKRVGVSPTEFPELYRFQSELARLAYALFKSRLVGASNSRDLQALSGQGPDRSRLLRLEATGPGVGSERPGFEIALGALDRFSVGREASFQGLRPLAQRPQSIPADPLPAAVD